MAKKHTGGFASIHRKIFDNPLYFEDPFIRIMAWIDLILLANHQDAGFRVRGIWVDVRRGQVGYGIDTLSGRWKWSRGKTERFIKWLEKHENIVRQKSNVTTLITILNYDKYQLSSKANSKANGHQTVKQTDINNNVLITNKKGEAPTLSAAPLEKLIPVTPDPVPEPQKLSSGKLKSLEEIRRDLQIKNQKP